jgi:ankyrin repeat protein
MGNTHSAVICRRPDSAKDLLRAAEAGDVQALKTLLCSDARLLLHYSVFGGNSAWHKAAKGGHAAVLEALEAAVQRHYEQDNKDLTEILKPSVLRMGTTAADVVARLVNKSNVKGFTPLMLACSGNHTEVVAWLIKHGALGRPSACLAGHCSSQCQAPCSL